MTAEIIACIYSHGYQKAKKMFLPSVKEIPFSNQPWLCYSPGNY